MKAAISIFIFIIATGIAILYFFTTQELKIIAQSKPIFICGNVDYEYSEEQLQGKNLFKIHCAACHKLDAQSTGPLLRSVKARYEEEKEISVDSFLRKRRASFKEIFNQKERKCLIPPEITNADIQTILLYTQ